MERVSVKVRFHKAVDFTNRNNISGMMTNPAFLIDQGFISTSAVKRTGVDWPNIQIYFAPAASCSIAAAEASKLFQQKYDVWDSVLRLTEGKDGFTIAFVLVRPKSVGEVKLQDKNPFSPPVIDPHYLEHPEDVKALMEGTKIVTNHLNFNKALSTNFFF